MASGDGIVRVIRHHRTATRVQTNITFRQRRQLPFMASGVVVAGPGQELSMVQIIAHIERPGEIAIVPAAAELGISPGELTKHVTVQSGMEIRPGHLLGEKKGRFGRKKSVESPVEGKILAVENGSIFVKQNPKTTPIRALLKGWVAYSIPERGVAVESKGTRMEAACGTSLEGYGDIKILSDDPTAAVSRDQITTQAQGKILVVGHLDQEQWVSAAADRGARGIIAGSITGELFLRLNQLELPVFATHGVGKMGMSTMIFDLLTRYDGRSGGMLAAETSHSRRPLIVLPDTAVDSTIVEDEQPQLVRGARVRVLRTDESGLTGEVLRIYPGRRTEVGERSICQADVRLVNGDVLTVLCRNLDIIM